MPEFDSKMKPEEKWDLVFENWINKIEQKKMIVSLLELKFWFESLEEFFTSSYLEELIFQYQSSTLRNASTSQLHIPFLTAK